MSFIPGDQYGGPDCFISCLHVLFTDINQIKKVDLNKGKKANFHFGHFPTVGQTLDNLITMVAKFLDNRLRIE